MDKWVLDTLFFFFYLKKKRSKKCSMVMLMLAQLWVIFSMGWIACPILRSSLGYYPRILYKKIQVMTSLYDLELGLSFYSNDFISFLSCVIHRYLDLE